MLTMTMTRLQMNLKYLGYYGGSIDGIKGNQTIEAIKNFQRNNGLTVDGIAGQHTIDKIREIICNEQRNLGVAVDGVAGQETINARNQKHSYSWNDVQHFKKSEFACKDGCGFDSIDLRVVKVLENIRHHFGDKPVIVTSGCRCAKHNKEVGGVQGSRHVAGKAVDFYIPGISTNSIVDYTNSLVRNGTLRYTYTGKYSNGNMQGAVHIDVV